jgi:hypothetical protein
MKNFIKYLGIIALVAVIGFSFAACGGDDGGGGNTPGGNPDGGGGGGGGGSGNWTPVADSTFGTSVAYGNSKFVVGGSGEIAYLSDGVSWTAVDTGTIFNYADFKITRKAIIRAIACDGNSTFVAVGDHFKIAYSSDNGVTWTAVKNIPWGGVETNFRAIAYGNGKFVAGLNGIYDVTSNLSYSSDGITWTTEENTTFGINCPIRAIAYGSGKFVVGGVNSGAGSGKIMYSSGDATWTLATDTTFAVYAIAYGNGFVAGGRYGKMAYSPDGVNWTNVADSKFGSDDILSIAYGNGKFVAVGENGKMVTSTDGTTWTYVGEGILGNNDSYNARNIQAIAFGNGKFVAAGGKIFYSTGL